MELGRTIIYAIFTQVDLVTTLSVAVLGGFVALLVQIAFHNMDQKKTRFLINWFYLVPVFLLLECAAVLLGYLVIGAVTAAIPSLLNTHYSLANLADQEINQLNLIRALAIIQFVAFFVGIICVILLLVKNRKMLRARLFIRQYGWR